MYVVTRPHENPSALETHKFTLKVTKGKCRTEQRKGNPQLENSRFCNSLFTLVKNELQNRVELVFF